jgi:hypothetical protein
MATRQRFHRSMTSPRPTVTVCRGGSQPQRISRICRTQHCINSASTAHRLRHRSSRKDDHEKSLALKSIRDACSSARLVSVEAGNVSEHPFGPNRAKILAATQTDFGPDRFRSSSLTTPASQCGLCRPCPLQKQTRHSRAKTDGRTVNLRAAAAIGLSASRRHPTRAFPLADRLGRCNGSPRRRRWRNCTGCRK